MRQVHDPYGGVNPLIDKMIGNAYDIVKYVARYLREIRYVAENMEDVYNVAHGYKATVTETANGSDLWVSLPDGVSSSNLEGVYVMAKLGSQVFFASENTFNFGVYGSDLIISIGSSLETAEFKCTFIYTPTE